MIKFKKIVKLILLNSNENLNLLLRTNNFKQFKILVCDSVMLTKCFFHRFLWSDHHYYYAPNPCADRPKELKLTGHKPSKNILIEN